MATTLQLIVEVCNAHSLVPKDGAGASSPYVLVDFDGQTKRTSAKAKDLNPQWDEKLEFLVQNPERMYTDVVEINVLNESSNGRRSNFLGRVKIYGTSFVKKGEETLAYYPLEKRSVFSHVKGEIGLKIYYIDRQEAKAEDNPDKKAENDKGIELSAQKEKDQSTQSEDKTKFDDPLKIGEDQVEVQNAPEKNDGSPKLSEDLPKGSEKNANSTKDVPKDSGDQTMEEPKSAEEKISLPSMDKLVKEWESSGVRSKPNDLVEQTQYLYVKAIKARDLAAKDVNGSSDPYVIVSVGNHRFRTRTIRNNLNPEWGEVFAVEKCKVHTSTIDITVWDEDFGKKDDFLGTLSLDLHNQVPIRERPDSPLAPQWYRLEESTSSMIEDGRNVKGDILLAVWFGTQADEAFPVAWLSDSEGLLDHTTSKVYLSPKLWYLRVSIVEAQDLQAIIQQGEFRVRAQLGFQVLKTKVSTRPYWNEDLVFVCAEPFEEILALCVEVRSEVTKFQDVGEIRVVLNNIEKRIDNSFVNSRWLNLDVKGKDADDGNGGADDENKKSRKGRIQARLCLDGGYHVFDEPAQFTSDVKPTAKQLWGSPIGVLEIGILGARNLMPMKLEDSRGSADAYCVAKYGQKWIRSRTVLDSLNPRWNEQYSWQVYDPCTVFTLAVFDNSQIVRKPVSKNKSSPDQRMGKLRIRLSTLENGRIYNISYPLLLLQSTGLQSMGEIDLAVRFSCISSMDVYHLYFQPLLPKMHYVNPFGRGQQELLRHSAVEIMASRLSRAEPPVPREVVHHMLDTEFSVWSVRRSKAHWNRILNLLLGVMALMEEISHIQYWKNPVTTALVHVVFLVLVWYPELVLPTAFVYMAVVGLWNYMYRPRMPPQMSADDYGHAKADELEEEFDTFPTSASEQVVRRRYDRLRMVMGRIQTVSGDAAGQLERFEALLSWRDPRATSVFMMLCLLTAMVLYTTPFRVIVVLWGLYVLRHPIFRGRLPPAPVNFVKRLPALSDHML